MIKCKYFLFIFILCLLLTSCPQDPNKGKGTSAETRDENGHLQEITYYDKNHNVYKTEYYKYLNKHDEDSRLIKVVINDIIDDEMEQYDRTVEDGQTIYEMKVCWKVAYALQNNTYKGYVITQEQEITDERFIKFSIIENKKIKIERKINVSLDQGIYYCENCFYQMNFDPKVKFQIFNYDFSKNQYNVQAVNYWTYKIQLD